HETSGSAQPLGAATVAVGAIESGNNDWYSVTAQPGQVLVFQTFTPGDAPGLPNNALDAKLEVFSADNTLLRTDDNSSPDGRNALVRVTAPLSGTYRVKVRASAVKGAVTTGEYVLSAQLVPNSPPVNVSAGPAPYT